MTEKNARKFLAEHEGEELCITYMVGRDGDIRFQPEPKVVPVSRLRRRAVAGVGLAAALAACTPSSAAEPPPTPVAEVAEVAEVADAREEVVEEPCLATKAEQAKPSMTALVAQARDKAAEQEAARKAEAILITEKEKAGPPIADVDAMPVPGGMMVPPTPPPTPTTKISHRRGGKRIARVK